MVHQRPIRHVCAGLRGMRDVSLCRTPQAGLAHMGWPTGYA